MDTIDLFCGAGGLSLGLHTKGFKPMLAVDIEADFCRSYQLNNLETKVLNQDIKQVDFTPYKPLLLCGGPPCQGFSTVGKKDRKDERNNLFWQFIRAIDEMTPEFVLFENVSGFKKLYNSEVFNTLVSELTYRSYKVEYRLLNCSTLGLPQNRTRTIVIGYRKKFKWLPLKGENLTLMDAISDLPELNTGERKDYYLPSKNNYQARLRADSTILSEHNCANYGAKMQKILSLVPPGGCVKDLPIDLQPKRAFSNTYARLTPDKPAPTITRNFGTPSSSRCIHPYQNRALSTREGARLQSFPDSYKFYGSKISKNLQIGNAVPPILAEYVGACILQSV